MKIRLPIKERDLLLHHANPSPELLRKFRFGVLDGSILTFELTPKEVEDLLRCTDHEVQYGKDRKIRRRFNRLYLRVFTAAEQQSTDALSGLFEDEVERFASDPQLAAKELLSSREFASMDDANSALTELSEKHNRMPRDEFRGLSPGQVAALLYSDWTSSDEGMCCRDDLPLAEVDQSEILHNARVFLAALREEKGTKATAKGNLNRKFVSSMVESMRWPDGYVEELWRFNKVLNEDDVYLLQVLNILTIRPVWQARNLQHRSGLPIHQRRLHAGA